MLLKSVRVRNFRCIKDEALRCDWLTALVGRNGCGKSTFLRALELFYLPAPRLSVDDFFAQDASQPIEIEVTFSELGPQVPTRFDAYAEDGDLAIVRVLTLTDGKTLSRFHGACMQFPGFAAVREAPTAGQAKQAYLEARTRPECDGLPAWTNHQAALNSLEEWESQHPDRCERLRDDGHFFGVSSGAEANLGEFTQLVFVPAVRDAADDTVDGKGSAISELIDLLVRSAMNTSEA